MSCVFRAAVWLVTFYPEPGLSLSNFVLSLDAEKSHFAS